MTLLQLVPLLARVALVLALSLLVVRLVPSGSASLRRWLLLLGVSGALALPLLSWLASGRQVLEVEAPRAVAHVVAEALAPSSSSSVAASAQLNAVPRQGAAAFAWEKAAGALWLLGALLLLGRSALGFRKARQLAGAARPNGEYRLSADVASPVVVGLFSPTILLPLAAEAWSPERLRAVLLHERAHVRRRDGLALLAAQTVCALYWFLPLSWWVQAGLRRECELAADEDVVAAGLRATRYAEHLLAIARAMRVPTSGVAMAAHPSELGRRIEALLERTGLPRPLTGARACGLGLVAMLLVALVACTGGATTRAKVASPSSSSNAVGTNSGAQRFAAEEAERTRGEWGAQRVAIVVLDAKSGRALATVDNRPGAAIVPASTLKPLTVAIALEAGVVEPGQRFDCGDGQRAYGEQALRDAGRYGTLSIAEILAVSSNVGVSRIFDALGGERLGAGLRRFGLEAPREIPDASLRGAIVALGEGTTTTPLALARAYAVLANDGSLDTERVVSAGTARRVRDMLEGVVTAEQATGKAAAVPGARVGGKTGTSDDEDCQACAQRSGSFASFVGIAPIDAPRYVIYVGVGQPSKPGTGGSIAAPVFSRLASRLLSRGG